MAGPTVRKRFSQQRRRAKATWRRVRDAALALWHANVLARVLGAMLIIWLAGGTLMFAVEGGNRGFHTWPDSMWNVLLTFFAASTAEADTAAGRVITTLLIVSGVVLVGLFTAGVASILVERSLRRREVETFKMEDHLVLCNWGPSALEWIREVHSPIVRQKRPIVVVHDNTDEIDLPEHHEDAAFKDVYIVRGDPVNEVVLRRASVADAYSVVVLADDRQGEHADGKTILVCVAVRHLCRGGREPNIVAECRQVRFQKHLRKAGADEVIAPQEFGLRLLARAALFHGMTHVYQELLTVGRNANEIYLVPVPPELIGQDFADAGGRFLHYRQDKSACLLIGVYRGEEMMLNPIGDEAGPLREGDELILLSERPPHPERPLPTVPPLGPPEGQ